MIAKGILHRCPKCGAEQRQPACVVEVSHNCPKGRATDRRPDVIFDKIIEETAE